MRWATLAAVSICLALTSVAEAQVPESIKKGCYDNVCLVQCPQGNGNVLGTGVYLGECYGTDIVVTAEHVIRGAGTILCNFQDGESIRAKVRGRDSQWDMAILELEQDTDRPGLDIAIENPAIGETLYAYGFPHGRTDKWLAGQVVAYKQSGQNTPSDWIKFEGGAIEGMSGGPVFNSRGEYVGPLWGTDGYTTTASSPGRLWKFGQVLLSPIRQWRANRIAGLTGQPAPDI